MVNNVGPTSVDAFSSASYGNINTLFSRRDWLIEKHTEHKARVSTITNVVTGNWFVEWPDLSQTPEAPTVANMIELGVNHWASIGGAILPSIRVPINKTSDRRSEKASVRKRERRVKELLESSNASELLALLWGDYAGGGSATLGAWVNFEEKDPTKRNPYLLRFDPRHTYTLTDNLGNVTEMLVARKISKGEVAAMYPEWASQFDKSRDEDVEEWYWYQKDRVIYAIVDVSVEGKKAERSAVIVDEPWDLGFVPVWEIVRPTFDGQRRGIFDQTIHIIRTMHRLMLMTIYSSEEHAFPVISSYDAVNPEDYGPGAIVQLRSSEGRIERLGPTSHFDVKDTISRLGEEASNSAVFPRQLQGDPGASIVSARGISASMGALDARLALAHKQFEVAVGKVCGFMLAMDEIYCPGKKTIVGDSRDTSESEEYDPVKDVAGSWVVMATYGIGAGSDPSNIEVRLNMSMSNGMISRETARRQLPFLDDPDGEPVLQLREAMQDSLIAGVLAMAQQGDPSVAAKALDLLQTDDLDMDAVIKELVDVIMNPEPPPGQPGQDGSADAIQGAESLARGGIPGSAEQAPAPGGGGLPPLGQILGQDSRQIS
jgi:hypothetical protein